LINPKIQQEVLSALDKLPERAQKEFAHYLQFLSHRDSFPSAANALLALSGEFDSRDRREMEEAIEEGCEQTLK
jgi:hypothetical protein